MIPRPRRLISALLVILMVAPLLVASAAAATPAPCCPDGRPPAEVPAPCRGSLLLVCCDDIATAPESDCPRTDPPSASSFVVPTSSGEVGLQEGEALLFHDLKLSWLSSALRRSVVLRV